MLGVFKAVFLSTKVISVGKWLGAGAAVIAGGTAVASALEYQDKEKPFSKKK